MNDLESLLKTVEHRKIIPLDLSIKPEQKYLNGTIDLIWNTQNYKDALPLYARQFYFLYHQIIENPGNQFERTLSKKIIEDVDFNYYYFIIRKMDKMDIYPVVNFLNTHICYLFTISINEIDLTAKPNRDTMSYIMQMLSTYKKVVNIILPLYATSKQTLCYLYFYRHFLLHKNILAYIKLFNFTKLYIELMNIGTKYSLFDGLSYFIYNNSKEIINQFETQTITKKTD